MQSQNQDSGWNDALTREVGIWWQLGSGHLSCTAAYPPCIGRRQEAAWECASQACQSRVTRSRPDCMATPSSQTPHGHLGLFRLGTTGTRDRPSTPLPDSERIREKAKEGRGVPGPSTQRVLAGYNNPRVDLPLVHVRTVSQTDSVPDLYVPRSVPYFSRHRLICSATPSSASHTYGLTFSMAPEQPPNKREDSPPVVQRVLAVPRNWSAARPVHAAQTARVAGGSRAASAPVRLGNEDRQPQDRVYASTPRFDRLPPAASRLSTERSCQKWSCGTTFPLGRPGTAPACARRGALLWIS